MKPVTGEYLRQMAGITGTKGKLLEALMKEKRKKREKLIRRSFSRIARGGP